MEKLPLTMIPPMGVQKVYRYEFDREVRHDIEEIQQWVNENLTAVSTLLYLREFRKLVVNTTSEDDLAVLILRYGISASASYWQST